MLETEVSIFLTVIANTFPRFTSTETIPHN